MNDQKLSTKRYHIAIDTGTGSIGWAIGELLGKEGDEDGNIEFVDAGVRIFDMPVEGDESLASLKRKAYALKRRIERRDRRKYAMIRELEPLTGISYQKWLELNRQHNTPWNDILELKAKGLGLLEGKNTELTPFQFLRCIVHYCKKRGKGLWDLDSDKDESIDSKFINEGVQKFLTRLEEYENEEGKKNPSFSFPTKNSKWYSQEELTYFDTLKKELNDAKKEKPIDFDKVEKILLKIDKKLKSDIIELKLFDRENNDNSSHKKHKREEILQNLWDKIYKIKIEKSGKEKTVIKSQRLLTELKDYNKEFYRNKFKDAPFPTYYLRSTMSYNFYNGKFKNSNKKKNIEPLLFNQEDYKVEVRAFLKEQLQHYPNLEEILKKHNLSSKEALVEFWVDEIIFHRIDFEDGNVRLKKKNDQTGEWERIKFSDYIVKMYGNCLFTNKPRETQISIYADAFRIMNEVGKLLPKPAKENEVKYAFAMKSILDFYFRTFEFNKKIVTEILEANDLRIESSKKNGKKDSEKMREFSNFRINLFLKNLSLSSEKIREKLTDNPFTVLIDDKTKEIRIEGENQLFVTNIANILKSDFTPKRKKISFDKFALKNYYKSFEDFNGGNLKHLQTKPVRVSKEFIKESIYKVIKEGVPLFDYINSAEVKKKEENTKSEFIKYSKKRSSELFAPFIDVDINNNPVAARSISQIRKVLKELFKQYEINNDKIVSIGLEVGRGLFNTAIEKKKIQEEQLRFRKEKEDFYKEVYGERKGNSNSNDLGFGKENWERVDIFLKQKRYDLYDFDENTKTFAKITPNLFKLMEKDHIYPKSWSKIDRKYNFVLSRMNYDKGDRLPLQYFYDLKKSEKFISSWKTAIKNLGLDERTQKILLMEKRSRVFEEENSERIENLHNTTTRYLVNWLEYEFKNKKREYIKIFEIPGAITSFLRTNWLNSKSWGFKYKEVIKEITPYDHMVDAIVALNIKSKQVLQYYILITKLLRSELTRIYKNYSQKNGRANKFSNELRNEFIEEVRRSIKALINSISNSISNSASARNIFNFAMEKLNHLLDEIDKMNLNDFNLELEKLNKKFVKPYINEIKQKIESFVPLKFELTDTYKDKEGNTKKLIRKKFSDVEDEKIFLNYKNCLVNIELKNRKQWSKDRNNLNKLYPHVSYKIDARVRRSIISKQSHLSVKELINKNAINKETKNGLVTYKLKEEWSDFKLQGKDNKFYAPSFCGVVVDLSGNKNHKKVHFKNVKTIDKNNGMLLRRNECFRYGQEIYRFVSYSGADFNMKRKSFCGKALFINPSEKNYNYISTLINEANQNEVVLLDKDGLISCNKLAKDKNVKKIEVSVLGKIKSL